MISEVLLIRGTVDVLAAVSMANVFLVFVPFTVAIFFVSAVTGPALAGSTVGDVVVSVTVWGVVSAGRKDAVFCSGVLLFSLPPFTGR